MLFGISNGLACDFDSFTWFLPGTLVDHQTNPDDPPPSLQPHYRAFITTTRRSVPLPRISTLPLTVPAAWGSPFRRPASTHRPAPDASCTPFPWCSSPRLIHRSNPRWFTASPCRAAAEGPPPSPAQHRDHQRDLLHRHLQSRSWRTVVDVADQHAVLLRVPCPVQPVQVGV